MSSTFSRVKGRLSLPQLVMLVEKSFHIYMYVHSDFFLYLADEITSVFSCEYIILDKCFPMSCSIVSNEASEG